MDVICKQIPVETTEEKVRSVAEEEKVIVCAYCSHPVTDPSKKIIVNDSFSHVFANPHGFVFEIGCFSKAVGCRPASSASDEFSWFTGYAWRIGICRACSGHLGWIFSSDSELFYGLILDKLIFP